MAFLEQDDYCFSGFVCRVGTALDVPAFLFCRRLPGLVKAGLRGGLVTWGYKAFLGKGCITDENSRALLGGQPTAEH